MPPSARDTAALLRLSFGRPGAAARMSGGASRILGKSLAWLVPPTIACAQADLGIERCHFAECSMVTNPVWRPQRIGHVLKPQSGWHELREPGLQLTSRKDDRDAIDNLEREAGRCSEDPKSGPHLLADMNSAAGLVDVQRWWPAGRTAGEQSDLQETSTLLTLGDWHTLRLTAVSAGEPSGQGCPPGGPVAAGPPVLMAERSMPAARHTAKCIPGRQRVQREPQHLRSGGGKVPVLCCCRCQSTSLVLDVHMLWGCVNFF